MLTIRQNFSNYASAKPSFGIRRADKEDYDRKREEYESYKADIDEAIDNPYLPNNAKKAFKVMKIGIEGITAALAVTYGAKKCAQLLAKGGKGLKESDFYKSAAKIFKPIKEGIGSAVDNAKEFIKTKYDNFLKKKWVAKKVKSLKKFFNKNVYGKKIAKMYNSTTEYIGKKYNAVKDYFKGITYEQGSNFVSGTLGAGSGLAAAYVAGKEEFPVSAPSQEDAEYDEEA
jgi:hypothetical protein